MIKGGKTGIWEALCLDAEDEHHDIGALDAVALLDFTTADIQRSVITDPDHPKFDLEAVLVQAQKDSA
jgi:hypothetical protein